MILLVTYDLKGSGPNDAFFDALKQQGTWWHYLSNTWLISTSSSPKQLLDALDPHLNKGDLILITRLGEYWGRLPKDAWDWVTKHNL